MSNKVKLTKQPPVRSRVEKVILVAMLAIQAAVEAGDLEMEVPCLLTGSGLTVAMSLRDSGFKPTDEEWESATSFIMSGDFHHYMNKGLLQAIPNEATKQTTQ